MEVGWGVSGIGRGNAENKLFGGAGGASCELRSTFY